MGIIFYPSAFLTIPSPLPPIVIIFTANEYDEIKNFLTVTHVYRHAWDFAVVNLTSNVSTQRVRMSIKIIREIETFYIIPHDFSVAVYLFG